MAHWAELDENNRVIRVTVGSNDEPDEGYGWLIANLGGRWVQTSYNASVNGFREKFAGPGDYYDESGDRFRVFYEEQIGTAHQFGMEFSYGRGAFIPEEDPDLVGILNYVNGLAFIDAPIIDAGAGIGNTSCVIATFTARTVNAVEPQEASVYWLNHNVLTNNVPLVNVVHSSIEQFNAIPFSLLFSNNMSDPDIHPMEQAIANYANSNAVNGSVVIVRSLFNNATTLASMYPDWTIEDTVGSFTVFSR